LKAQAILKQLQKNGHLAEMSPAALQQAIAQALVDQQPQQPVISNRENREFGSFDSQP
jgi:hypothetical protein